MIGLIIFFNLSKPKRVFLRHLRVKRSGREEAVGQSVFPSGKRKVEKVA